jgi:hypothetical protein
MHHKFLPLFIKLPLKSPHAFINHGHLIEVRVEQKVTQSSFCKEDILKTTKTAEKSSVSQRNTRIIVELHTIMFKIT